MIYMNKEQIENMNIEGILTISNFWLGVERIKKTPLTTTYTSIDNIFNKCIVEKVLDIKSRKYTYYVEIKQHGTNKTRQKACINKIQVLEFLDYTTF